MRSTTRLPFITAAKPVRVAEALEREIRSGQLRFGAQLESESDLGRRFSVSRTTVRKGLEALAGKGLITTRVGIGSFVTFDGQTIDNALGWTRALANRKDIVETRIHCIERRTDEGLARLVNAPSAEFIAIDRSRSLKESQRVVSLERSRVPLRPELEHILSRGLSHGSLSATFREAGIVPASGAEWAEIECLNAADALILGTSAETPYLRTTRLVRDTHGHTIEYVVSLLDPRHFALHLEF